MDSIKIQIDSPVLVKTIPQQPVIKLNKLLADNIFLNSKGQPVSNIEVLKKHNDENDLFYILACLLLVFGIAKAVYSKYFSTMFRVFFNSSLRQSQLTDQLVQDKLPSLIFNILFVLIVGVFIYLLIVHYNYHDHVIHWQLLGLCFAAFAAIYFVKFVTLKFTGWITGYKQEADIYTFIVFLINKIIAVCLLPVIVIIAFSTQKISYIFILISFVIIGIMLLMRFFRSYGLLQSRLKVSRFHFLLYIFSLEILPLLLIYKTALFFFSLKL